MAAFGRRGLGWDRVALGRRAPWLDFAGLGAAGRAFPTGAGLRRFQFAVHWDDLVSYRRTCHFRDPGG